MPLPDNVNPPLDIEQPAQLIEYLRAIGRIGEKEVPQTRVLAGGVSNRGVIVRRRNGEAWVLKQALGKLRVAVDWHADPRRIEREALGMRYLAELLPPGSVPELLFQDPPHHLLAMTAVPRPHVNWKSHLLLERLEQDHIRQFGRMLAAIHRGSHERRKELARVFKDRSFFESLRVEPYYLYSAEQCPAAARFLRALVKQTRVTREALVHGDYSPKNILIHGGRLILLDHEVIHWGDPAFDVGFSMTHLLSKAHHFIPQHAAFAAGAAEYWHAYSEALGDVPWRASLGARAAKHTAACLLARVAGRSPLEYLDSAERRGQAEVALELMQNPPEDMPALIDAFLYRIERKERRFGR
jgi:5-methylthioribose kinase